MTTPHPLHEVPLTRLRERSSIKWRRYPDDVLPLWVAEMDVDLAPPVREALERAVRDGDTGYPSTSVRTGDAGDRGASGYVEAFSGFAQRRWSWSVATPQVQPVASVIEGYTDALLAAVGAGGTVVITAPVYPPFTSYLVEAGLKVVEAGLTAHLRLDLDAIDAALTSARSTHPGGPGTGPGLLLCNPHNPGGTLHTRAELEALAVVAHSHGATVVSDEIHAPIVYSPGVFTPYLSVDPRGMALHAASKAFNLAAIPAALLVFGDDAGAAKRRIAGGAHHMPSHFGALAQEVAYREGDAWLDGLLGDLTANRALLTGLVASALPSVKMYPLEATYLPWLDFRDSGLGDDPAAILIDRGRVALNSGPTFGSGGAGHARLNIATRPDVIEEAVARIATALS